MGKEAVEGLEGIAAVLRNPGRALASLGQQVTDTVEEKGIPYALSYVTADVVIGILVDKGLGKIRGMNKADDLEAGVKAVEKIVDVADTVDDFVSVGGLDSSINGNLTIMSRNSSRGNPSAITHFDVELSTR